MANRCKSFYKSFTPLVLKSKPSPSNDEIKSDEFTAIWDVIKTWDIKVPEYDNGYMGANGSHVKLIIDGLKPVLRNKRIDKIINK